MCTAFSRMFLMWITSLKRLNTMSLWLRSFQRTKSHQAVSKLVICELLWGRYCTPLAELQGKHRLLWFDLIKAALLFLSLVRQKENGSLREVVLQLARRYFGKNMGKGLPLKISTRELQLKENYMDIAAVTNIGTYFFSQHIHKQIGSEKCCWLNRS